MTPTVYTDIRAALITKLKLTPGLPKIVTENTAYVETAGVPFVLPSVMISESAQAELGVDGRIREQGILQVLCSYPKGAGVDAMNTLLGNLKDTFKSGTMLVYNDVHVEIVKAYPSPARVTTNYEQVMSILFRSLL